MKKLSLLLLALPLAACTTVPTTISQNCSRFTGIDYGNCVGAFTPNYAPLSHWQVATGNGAFLASGAQASAASGPISPYPAYSPH